MIARLVLLALLALAAGCGSDEPAARQDPLLAALRDGGHVLVFRHAITEQTTDRQEFLRSCELQRNLSGEGRAQAREIGEGIRTLEIPIGEVRSSPMCRARDTAQLAFGRVTLDRDLVSPGVIGDEADDERRARVLRDYVEAEPPPGENTVIVTHTGNIGAGLGEQTVAEGEALVYGEGGKLVGRIRAERWAALVRSEARRG